MECSLNTYIRWKWITVLGKERDQWSIKIIFHENFKFCSYVKAKWRSSRRRGQVKWKYKRLMKWNTKTNWNSVILKNEIFKMRNFFICRTGGKLEKGPILTIFKKTEDSHPLSLNWRWECFHKVYWTRIKTAILVLRECQAKGF